VTTSGALAATFVLLLAVPNLCVGQDAKPASPSKVSAPPETVIVTGHHPSREERDRIVWNFVYAHARLAPKIDQLSRWISPYCPEVQNLPPAFATFITDRMKAVAKSVGAPVKEPCKTNIEIIFTSDPQSLMTAVAQKDPQLLGFHYVHQTDALATVTRPIQAWYVTATSNRVETYIDDPYHAAPGGAAGSRFSRGELSVFAHILIVADARKVAGYPAGQIADYFAMLSLSEADAPDDCRALPSILDLLSSDCPASLKPESLTPPDRSYLEGLYAMDPDEIGSLQRSAIANHMLRSPGSP
jgi:hypothetical protein